MSTTVGVRWPLVLLGGFLAEVSAIALVLPIALLNSTTGEAQHS